MVSPASCPPGVSVVICTYNGAARIGTTLDHLLHQRETGGIAWEVILVDNHSEDNTAAIAQSTWVSGIPFHVVTEWQRGITHARNAGILAAKYEYISFIDDDNHVDPFWVRNLFRTFEENPGIDVCGGNSEALFETAPPYWFEKVKGAWAVGHQGETTGDVTMSRGTLWGAGISFRRSCFDKIIRAGFRYHTTGRKGANLSAGDDSELSLAFVAAGCRLWYVDELRLKHYMPEGRLTWEHAKKIFRGLGESELLLDLYRMAIRQGKFPLCRIYLSLIPYSILYFGWRFVNLAHHQEGNPRYLSYLARKNYIMKALKSWDILPEMMRDIRAFCNRVSSETR